MKPIIIDKFTGIGDSPQTGFDEVFNLNTDEEGVCKLNPKTTRSDRVPYTNVSFIWDTNYLVHATLGTNGNDIRAVVFTGTDLPNPLVAGTTYWLVSVSATQSLVASSFQNARKASPTTITITDAGSGTMTFSTVAMGLIKSQTQDPVTGFRYAVDTSGKVWIKGPLYYWCLIDGNTLTNASGLGCVTYRDYLFVFRNDKMDVFGPITSSGLDSAAWTNGLVTLNTAAGTSNSHHAIVGQDDIIYYCDGKYIGSFAEASGKTFAPADGTTFVSTTQALDFQNYYLTTCLS